MSACLARLKTWWYHRRYEKATKATAKLDLVVTLSGYVSPPAAWQVPHPKHNQRLAAYMLGLKNDVPQKTIAFGDSLMDGPRDDFDAVKSAGNFAISGSWAQHMAAMAHDIRPFLDATGRTKDVKAVIVGSLGGNPLLVRQPVAAVIEHSLRALNEIRVLFPSPRFIVYGIPPTVSAYVNVSAIAFEAALYSWVFRDTDAVFIPLCRKFGGFFPRAIMTADGVHMTPLGIQRFDELMERGKTAPARSIVD